MTDGVNLGSAYAKIDLDISDLQRAVREAQRPLSQLDQGIAATGAAATRAAREHNRLVSAQVQAAQSAGDYRKALDILSREIQTTEQGTERYYRLIAQSNRVFRQAQTASEKQARAIRDTGTAAEQSSQQIRTLRGGISGLNAAVGALGGALAGLELLDMANQAMNAARDLAAVEARVQALINDQQQYNDIVELATEQQRLYGGSLADNIAQLGSLANSARNAGLSVEELNLAAQRLLLIDPTATFEDAAIALREALSGDITSLAERFELSRSALRELSDETLTGTERMQILNRVLNEQGATVEAVTEGVDQQVVAYNELAQATERLQLRLGQLLNDGLEPTARGLTRVIDSSLLAIEALIDLDNVMIQNIQRGEDYQAFADAQSAFANAQSALANSSQKTQDQLAQQFARLQLLRFEYLAAASAYSELEIQQQLGLATQEQVNEAMETARNAGRELRETSEALESQLNNLADTQGELANSTTTTTEATEEQIAALAKQERAVADANDAILELDEDYQQERQELRQEYVDAVNDANADLAAAERDHTDRIADINRDLAAKQRSITEDANRDIADAYRDRNDKISDIQRDLGDSLEDIAAETNQRLIDQAEDAARREAEARARVAADIQRTLADSRVAAEINDISAVGATPEDRGEIQRRERLEEERLQLLEKAQQEAARIASEGEAELAAETFAAREQAISEREQLEHAYEQRMHELRAEGNTAALEQLQQERQEALEAIKAREDQEIQLAQQAAEQRQQEREQERQNIIKEGELRKAAAREAAQEQIKAAEEAANKQIAAAIEAARIQRQEAAARAAEARQEAAQRLQDQQNEIRQRLSNEQRALNEQAQAALRSYQERRSDLERALNEQLVEYGRHYAETLGLTKEEQATITQALKNAYGVQERDLSTSMRARLQTVRNAVQNFRSVANETGNATSTAAAAAEDASERSAEAFRDWADRGIAELNRLNKGLAEYAKRIRNLPSPSGGGNREPEGRAAGGPVEAGQLYEVGEQGPEYFVPGMDGAIIPHGLSRQLDQTMAAIARKDQESGDVAPGMDTAIIPRALPQQPDQTMAAMTLPTEMSESEGQDVAPGMDGGIISTELSQQLNQTMPTIPLPSTAINTNNTNNTDISSVGAAPEDRGEIQRREQLETERAVSVVSPLGQSAEQRQQEREQERQRIVVGDRRREDVVPSVPGGIIPSGLTPQLNTVMTTMAATPTIAPPANAIPATNTRNITINAPVSFPNMRVDSTERTTEVATMVVRAIMDAEHRANTQGVR